MLQGQIKKLHPEAKVPLHIHSWDAGYNLFSVETVTLQPGQRHPFKTGIALTLPAGYYARIAPRSGMAFRNGIDVLAWVIDHNYTGEYIVILINLGDEPYEVLSGDKIAQAVFEKCHIVEFTEVDELGDFERGAKGFGSSGR